MGLKRVLHVGCGPAASGPLHRAFRDGWREVRLDIDPGVAPDLVANITDMRGVAEDGSFDAVFSSHNLEHLYAHEVPRALGEFRRVLNREGFALITLPDLQEVARLVADGALTAPAYISAAGPIAPLDILYGQRAALARGNLHMSHRTGFTGQSLANALTCAGFASVCVQRNPRAFALWAVAFAAAPDAARLHDARERMLPLRAGMLVPA